VEPVTDLTPDPLNIAIAETTALLVKFCVPLYQYGRNRRPHLNGTGFFVRSGAHNFLVSAAHVLDTAKTDGLFFYIDTGTVRHLSGKLLRTKGEGNRSMDLIDVGVLHLSGDSVPPYPNADKFPMDFSYLCPRYRPRTGKDYIFIGFPASKSKVSGARREVAVTPYGFRNEPIEEGMYSSHGLNPEMHIALKLDVRKGFGPGGTKQHFPDPGGMSGSPIVVLYDYHGQNDDRIFPVVGVATRHRKASRLVFGADIAYVVDAIQNAV
jgi:hypothetical protein